MAVVDLDIAAALGRLYAAEFRCPMVRLDQSMPWVNRAAGHERQALERIAAEDREHLGWLTNLILSRGSSPPPVSYSTNAADTHYMTIQSLLPRLIHAERSLLAEYSAAAAALADDAEAARLAARIVGRHTQHLAAFEALDKPAA